MDTFIIDSSKNKIQIGNNSNLVNMINCSITNLSGNNANLTNITGSYASISNISFTNASIVNLSASNMSTVNLLTVNLSNINLSTVNLTSTNMSTVNLSATNTTGVNISNTNFTSTNMSTVNLSATNTTGVNISNTNLTSTNMSTVNLSATNTTGVNISNTNFTSTNMSTVNLSATNTTATNISNTNLTSTNMSTINLSATNTTGVNISNINLTSTNMSTLNLNGINISNVNLTSSNTSTFNLYSSTILTSSLSATNFSGTNISTVNLSVSGNTTFTNTPICTSSPEFGYNLTNKAYVDTQSGQSTNGINLYMNPSLNYPSGSPFGKDLSNNNLYFFDLSSNINYNDISINNFNINYNNFNISTKIVNNSETDICAFITPIGFPYVTNIPSGLWIMNLYSYISDTSGSVFYYFSVYKNTTSNLIANSAYSRDVNGSVTSTPFDIYTMILPFPDTSMNVTDRILITIKAKTVNIGSPILNTMFEGSNYSFVTTSLNSGTKLLSSNNNWSGQNNFSNVSISNLTATNVSNTNLTSTKITVDNVSNTNLTSTKITVVNVSNTNLTATNISNTNLTATNFSNTNLTAFNSSISNASVYNLSAYNSSINLLWGPSCTIPIGGIIMYSGVWPPKDASNNTPSGITNMFSSERWILCDGGTNIQPPWPDPLPNGVLKYTYTAPTTNVQGKIIISVPNSTITLTIPDLRGRFVMGYIGTSNFAYSNTITSAQTTNQQLLAAQSNQTGATISGVANYPGGINNFGGVMTQVLSNTEMPTHTHNMAAHTHGMQHKHNFQHVHGMQHAHEYSYVNNTNNVGEIAGNGNKQAMGAIGYSNDRDTSGTRAETDGPSQHATSQQSTSDMYDTANATQLVTSTQTPSATDTFPTGGNSQGATAGNTNPRSNLPPYWVLAYIMRIG